MKIKNKNLKKKKKKKIYLFLRTRNKKSGFIRIKPEKSGNPKKIFWLIDLGNFQNLGNFHF